MELQKGDSRLLVDGDNRLGVSKAANPFFANVRYIHLSCRSSRVTPLLKSLLSVCSRISHKLLVLSPKVLLGIPPSLFYPRMSISVTSLAPAVSPAEREGGKERERD